MIKYLGFYKKGAAKIPYKVEGGLITYGSSHYTRWSGGNLGDNEFLIPGYHMIMEVKILMARSTYASYEIVVESHPVPLAVSESLVLQLFNEGYTPGSMVRLITNKTGSEIRHRILENKEYNEIKDKIKPLDRIIKDQKKINLLRAAGLSESAISKKLEK
jgi:hypothetical protein